jgi:putative membrane protein
VPALPTTRAQPWRHNGYGVHVAAKGSSDDRQSGQPTRWPARVYGVGTEPDPRFTLANERTFLAWLRTSLALMAAGVGVLAAGITSRPVLRDVLAIGLLVAGVACSAAAFSRWMKTERALRTGRPLPSSLLAPLLGYGLALAGVLALILLLPW